MDRHHHNGAAAPERTSADPVGLAPLGTCAAPPAGLSPPPKSEPPGVQAEGFRGQGQDDRPDSPPALADEQAGAADTKRFATLRARLALAGWALSRTDAGNGPTTFYATRWGMARELASLDAVAEFADRVEARLHPLLFDACRCGIAGRLRCLACWRWQRHHAQVQQRRSEWRAAR